MNPILGCGQAARLAVARADVFLQFLRQNALRVIAVYATKQASVAVAEHIPCGGEAGRKVGVFEKAVVVNADTGGDFPVAPVDFVFKIQRVVVVAHFYAAGGVVIARGKNCPSMQPWSPARQAMPLVERTWLPV